MVYVKIRFLIISVQCNVTLASFMKLQAYILCPRKDLMYRYPVYMIYGWVEIRYLIISVQCNVTLASFMALQTYIVCVRKDLIYADTFGIPSIHDLWFM